MDSLDNDRMGSEQSLLKAVASAKKRQDTTLVFRGETIDTKWIPEDDVQSLKLEIVKLIDMHFVIVPPVLFQILSIKQLDLSSNNLVSVTGIGALANLTDLDLSGNHLDYLPDDLGNCKNLSFLNVSQNSLTIRSIPPVFYDGRSFSSLDISENRFGRMTPELITLLAAIESVSIHSNPWDIIELRSLLPTSSEEHVKTLLKVLKSTVLASGMNAATATTLPQKQGIVAAPKPIATTPSVVSAVAEADITAERPSLTKKRDSIVKRLSLNSGKQSKLIISSPTGGPSSLDNDSEAQTPLNGDSEAREPAKENSAPPAIPPSRDSPTKTGVSAPPVVSKSPAAVAPAPPPTRTQNALKTPSRPAGPKGRRLPTADFIENNAQEDEILVLAKDGKTEIPVTVLSSGTLQGDGPPPSIPSKQNRPQKSNSVSVQDKPYKLHGSGTTSVVPSREPSVSRDSSRPTLTKDVPLAEVQEQDDNVDIAVAAKLMASPSINAKKPPVGGISMMFGGLPRAQPPSKPAEDNESTSPVPTPLSPFANGGHKLQASEASSVIRRQNTLTEQGKEDEAESAAGKVPNYGKKPPVGRVSMFSGAISGEDSFKKTSDASAVPAVPAKKAAVAEPVIQAKETTPVMVPPVKKQDTVGKEQSLSNLSTNKKPAEKSDSLPSAPISASSSPKKADPPSVPVPATSNSAAPPPTIGKKPPVGGISMFGGAPQPSIPISTIEPKEESAVTAPAQAPPQKESSGKKLFSMFNQSATSSTSDPSKDVSGKKDIPNKEPIFASPAVPKKPEQPPSVTPKEQPSTTAPPPSKKPPVGGVSMYGGPPATTEAFKEGSEGGGNSGSFKKPPPGAVSMFGGAGMPIPRKESVPPSVPSASNDDDSSSDQMTPSELRERLKQQLSNNHQVDASSGPASAPSPATKPKPAPSTLPRSFKPSDMDTSDKPALPSKLSNTSKSSDKLSGK